MYRNRKTGMIGIIITTLILILTVILSNIDVQKMSYLENAFNSFVMPIQNGLTYLKNKMEGNSSFFTDISKLQDENEELKRKNSELEQSLREFEIVKAENETLKEYVGLKDQYQDYQTIPAYIINKDITNYNQMIVINVGEKDGIKPNMTVIADQGLVGYVVSTTQTTAKVQTIIDTASSVSCNISTSREPIIVTGTLEKVSTLKASYIPTDAVILENDKIETSGIGGIYPKGISIGTIKEIVNTKNITDRYAYVETAVDFKKLETVLVITNNKAK
ncbi:MAG: rod shape-determining protein MreC [Clostridia bacterium]|jgi:rod shape-determining protein MreC|nr:rod shape-determining protein MreC [Clostridia bacterium]MCI9413310.1 rod shape-determining protein MreC [Clostridia bacterium]